MHKNVYKDLKWIVASLYREVKESDDATYNVIVTRKPQIDVSTLSDQKEYLPGEPDYTEYNLNVKVYHD